MKISTPGYQSNWSLPYDQYHLSGEYRTGRGILVSFDFGPDLSHDFLSFASSYNRNLQHLALACYDVLLSKLTDGERDLCIGIDQDSRYKNELKFIIGMFLTFVPFRCHLDLLFIN